LGVERFDGQDLDPPGDAGYAVAVVAEGADDTGHCRSMRFAVVRNGRVVHEVVALVD